MKKVFALLIVVLLAFAFVACDEGGGDAGDKVKVGIAMPTKSLQRWNQDGDYLKAEFEKAGFEVDLQYGGDNVIAEQVAQVENMITTGCKVLIITPIDAASLSTVLEPAIEQDIAVFAYDRLITNTEAVDYYISFDNEQVGREQAKYIVEKLDLENAEGPFNMEIFTGDPGDTNAAYFYGGAMEVMDEYIKSGKVVVLSRQTTQAQTATPEWKAEFAQARMDNIVTSVGYGPTSGTKLDAVLCSNDSTAQGVITSLTTAGWDASNIPVITGQDADKPNVAYLLQGLQGVSVFKDTRLLAEQTRKMVMQYLEGKEVEVNNVTTYNNGVKVVESYCLELVSVTKDNIEKELFDSGYYSWDDPELAEAKAAKDAA
jgi:putative multiple sugar transport system substrate-binding protein